MRRRQKGGGGVSGGGQPRPGVNQEPGIRLSRPTDMKRMAVLDLVLAAAAVAGCASAAPPAPLAPSAARPAIPPEFRAACGHPGAQVEVRKVPVTISHAACDLTGVAISYRNRGGATVPHGGTGIGNSDGFELTVHPGSRDVTITVTGPHGNM